MNELITQDLELIEIKNNIAFADSLHIAEHFGKRHYDVIQHIEKLMKNDKKINDNCRLSFYMDTYNRKQKKYLLTKDAFVFVVQKFQGKKAHQWQWMYIEAFNKMEAIITEKQSTDWQLARQNGKLTRRKETDAISIFIQYAQAQGSTKSGFYYKHFTNMVHKAVGIENGERDCLTPAMFAHVATFEDQVSSLIIKLINEEQEYRDIYQTVKAKIALISEIMIMPTNKYLPILTLKFERDEA